ncbi:hypothetical protein [Streptomyces poonensis]|nr:hypothetical protein [Streptomyces poonensis]
MSGTYSAGRTDEKWDVLLSAHAIVLGPPASAGSVSGTVPAHRPHFAESTGRRWVVQAWRGRTREHRGERLEPYEVPLLVEISGGDQHPERLNQYSEHREKTRRTS